MGGLNTTVLGGTGGHGSNGMDGGNVTVDLSAVGTSIFVDDLTVTAGNGGDTDADVNNAGRNTAGNNGSSGNGGSVDVTANNVTTNANIAVTSGDAGIKNGTGMEIAGNGGNAELAIGGTLSVEGAGAHNFDFTKGAQSAIAGTNALNVDVNYMNIAENNEVVMDIQKTGAWDAADSIAYEAIQFNYGSTFTTDNVVGNAGTGGLIDYYVGSLYVHNNGIWNTHGTYSPTTANNDYMVFNMTDVKQHENGGVSMLIVDNGTGSHSGVVDLSAFDPVAQHLNHLANPDNNQAFITSDYQLKRLNLGNITLIDRTSGNHMLASREDQEAADYFGFTSGLRRYYWDTFDSHGVDTLTAHNFYTADGYRIYLQGNLAALTNAIQTFWNTTDKVMDEAADGELHKFMFTVKTGASHVKHDTGSWAKVDNISVAVSGSYKFDNIIGHTTIGVIGEYGHGRYNVSSNIDRLSSYTSNYRLKGKGDTDQFGLGLFIRNEFLQGTYVEASVRGCYMDTDFKTRNWQFSNQHRWDNDNMYWSAHVGIGHEFNVTSSTLLDTYAKLLWTHTDSSSFTTNFDEHVKFSSADSLRTRVGARVTQDLVENEVKAYIGGAWEHEFDGEAKGRVGHYTIGYDSITDAPDLKGSSFFGEVGLSYQPADTGLSFDAGMFGLAGKQDGFGGYVGVKLTF